MIIGSGIIILRLPENNSLKGKRKIVKAIIGKMRNKFNASVSEVAANDMHRRAEIGFALVGNDHKLINSKIDKIFNMVDEMGLAELIDTDMEIIHL
ncbi:Cytoplasmic protein [Candidatus Magnetomoraceae bacterium gMMP-13]